MTIFNFPISFYQLITLKAFKFLHILFFLFPLLISFFHFLFFFSLLLLFFIILSFFNFLFLLIFLIQLLLLISISTTFILFIFFLLIIFLSIILTLFLFFLSIPILFILIFLFFPLIFIITPCIYYHSMVFISKLQLVFNLNSKHFFHHITLLALNFTVSIIIIKKVSLHQPKEAYIKNINNRITLFHLGF